MKSYPDEPYTGLDGLQSILLVVFFSTSLLVSLIVEIPLYCKAMLRSVVDN